MNKEFYRSGKAMFVKVTPIKHISVLVFIWLLVYSSPKALYSSVLQNNSPKLSDWVWLMEGCVVQCGHTQGQRWSQAVNHRAVKRVLYTELVNNKPTQEQTGPQSNQCRFNVYRPLCACVCVWMCLCVGVYRRARSLDQSTGERGWQNNDLSSVFISLSFFFAL